MLCQKRFAPRASGFTFQCVFLAENGTGTLCGMFVTKKRATGRGKGCRRGRKTNDREGFALFKGKQKGGGEQKSVVVECGRVGSSFCTITFFFRTPRLSSPSVPSFLSYFLPSFTRRVLFYLIARPRAFLKRRDRLAEGERQVEKKTQAAVLIFHAFIHLSLSLSRARARVRSRHVFPLLANHSRVKLTILRLRETRFPTKKQTERGKENNRFHHGSLPPPSRCVRRSPSSPRFPPPRHPDPSLRGRLEGTPTPPLHRGRLPPQPRIRPDLVERQDAQGVFLGQRPREALAGEFFSSWFSLDLFSLPFSSRSRLTPSLALLPPPSPPPSLSLTSPTRSRRGTSMSPSTAAPATPTLRSR